MFEPRPGWCTLLPALQFPALVNFALTLFHVPVFRHHLHAMAAHSVSKLGKRIHFAPLRRFRFRVCVFGYSICSRFCLSLGSFIDGKRTGLSGYIFREMAGKHRFDDLRIADEVAGPSFIRFLLPPSFLFQSWLSLKSALGVGQMVNLFHICVVLHRSTQDNLMLILQVNNATQARIANCHYCEFDLHIEVDHPQSGIGDVLTAADMQYIPVQAPPPPYKPSQFCFGAPSCSLADRSYENLNTQKKRTKPNTPEPQTPGRS